MQVSGPINTAKAGWSAVEDYAWKHDEQSMKGFSDDIDTLRFLYAVSHCAHGIRVQIRINRQVCSLSCSAFYFTHIWFAVAGRYTVLFSHL